MQRSAAPLTIGELAASYFESRMHLKPSTRRADAQIFLYHVAPVFGETPLRRVRARFIGATLNMRAA